MKAIILIALLFAVTSATWIEDAEYRITCVGSGDGKTNVLDVEKEFIDGGVPIIVYPWHNGYNQRFVVNHVDGDWATLTAVNSDLVITVGGNDAGAFFTQEEVSKNWASQFKFIFTSDGYFLINNRASGLYITCPDSQDLKTKYGNFAAVQGVKKCNKNEKWNFQQLPRTHK